MRVAAVLSAVSLQTAGCASLVTALGTAASAVNVPAAAVDEPRGTPGAHEVALLAGGCFWGVQGVFEHVRGVDRAVSGYAGGAAPTAHYDLVSAGTTGHAESVQITYDASQITYGQLLRIYSPSLTTRPSSTSRAPMSEPNIGRQFSRRPRRRKKSPLPTSISLTQPRSSAPRSSPTSRTTPDSFPPRHTTRIS